MGECKTITINELLEGNKRVCLLPLRVMNKCEQCPQFKNCESKKINPILSERLKKINDLEKEIKQRKKDLYDLKGGLNLN